MPPPKPCALIVEDDASSRRALCEIVGRQGFEVRDAASLKDARQIVDGAQMEVLLVDLELPDGDGSKLLEHPNSALSHVFIVTGDSTLQTVVDAMRRGARDYFTKPVDTRRLQQRLDEVLEAHRSRGDVVEFHGILGRSPAMQRVFKLIQKVAPTSATVFITGESGTGKERVAQAIHELSGRNRPFVPVNCGAVSPTLAESEFFGHERGSFTGADKSHRGYFEQADGGTLFLDEVTEMPLDMQVKLLRVLESSVVPRLGSEKSVEVKARVIAATNRPPESAVEQGKLRQDLYYRLQVFRIALPPLRERKEDIEILCESFLKELNLREGAARKLTREALEVLQGHDWPGNIRELRNVIESAHILASSRIEVSCLPENISGCAPLVLSSPSSPPAAAAVGSEDDIRVPVGTKVKDAERELILATLKKLEGDKPAAARVLGMSLKTLYNRLHQYSDDPEASRWLRSDEALDADS